METYGPQNGIVDEIAEQVLAEVMPQGSGMDAVRSRVGDSGISGGLALAAGLLSGHGKDHIMTVSMSRGGVQAATVVERRDGSQ